MQMNNSTSTLEEVPLSLLTMMNIWSLIVTKNAKNIVSCPNVIFLVKQMKCPIYQIDAFESDKLNPGGNDLNDLYYLTMSGVPGED